MREFGGISQEENRGVVGDQIPIAFVGSELDGKSSGVSSAIVRARPTTDGGESDGYGAFLAFGTPDVERGKVIGRGGAFKETMGSGALCVDNTFRDTLSVKVGEKVDKTEILKEEGIIVAAR